MSLRADFCIKLDPIDQWVNDGVLLRDVPSIAFIKHFKDFLATFDESYTFYNKRIGPAFSGMGASPINTIPLNTNFICPGDEIITLLDNAIIYHDKHGFFYNDSIAVEDNTSVGQNTTLDTTNFSCTDVIAIALISELNDEITVVVDSMSKDIQQNINYVHSNDSLGSHIIGRPLFNSELHKTSGRYPIILEDETDIQITQ